MALVALQVRALSRSGAAAAFIVGTLTFGSGEIGLTLVLLAFFVPSILLSRVGRRRKKGLTDIGKAGPRDAAQVLANGGVATLAAVVAGIGFAQGSPRWSVIAVAAFAGAYAAATADTWGTEIGTLVRGSPRSILTLRPIATGLSGGVSLAGTVAEFAGALWIAWVAGAALDHLPLALRVAPWAAVVAGVSLGGVAGALADSLLGATLQELRACPLCERPCETDPHHCGTPTARIRGLRGFSNDVVNACATAVGALVATGFVLLYA